jgi:hypothetical protein
MSARLRRTFWVTSLHSYCHGEDAVGGQNPHEAPSRALWCGNARIVPSFGAKVVLCVG